MLWSYRPELRPDEVVELLYSYGWNTGERAEFALGEAQAIHRISVCAALACACASGSTASCPPLDCHAAPPAGSEHRRELARRMRALLDDPETRVRVHRSTK